MYAISNFLQFFDFFHFFIRFFKCMNEIFRSICPSGTYTLSSYPPWHYQSNPQGGVTLIMTLGCKISISLKVQALVWFIYESISFCRHKTIWTASLKGLYRFFISCILHHSCLRPFRSPGNFWQNLSLSKKIATDAKSYIHLIHDLSETSRHYKKYLQLLLVRWNDRW